jgi:hypothetical protein
MVIEATSIFEALVNFFQIAGRKVLERLNGWAGAYGVCYLVEMSHNSVVVLFVSTS